VLFRSNRTAFGADDPINNSDPSGLWCEVGPKFVQGLIGEGVVEVLVCQDLAPGDLATMEDYLGVPIDAIRDLWASWGWSTPEGGTGVSGFAGGFALSASATQGPTGHTFFVKSPTLEACPREARFTQKWMRTLWWSGDPRYVEGELTLRRASQPTARIGGWAWYAGHIRAVQEGQSWTAVLYDGFVMGEISCASGSGALVGFSR